MLQPLKDMGRGERQCTGGWRPPIRSAPTKAQGAARLSHLAWERGGRNGRVRRGPRDCIEWPICRQARHHPPPPPLPRSSCCACSVKTAVDMQRENSRSGAQFRSGHPMPVACGESVAPAVGTVCIIPLPPRKVHPRPLQPGADAQSIMKPARNVISMNPSGSSSFPAPLSPPPISELGWANQCTHPLPKWPSSLLVCVAFQAA